LTTWAGNSESEYELTETSSKEKIAGGVNHCPPYCVIRQNPTIPIPG
jgi:hypothetical protein